MGNAAPHVKPGAGGAMADPRNYLQHDLPKFIIQKKMGAGKFMKSFLCKVEEGVPIVVKVYVKHDGEGDEHLLRAKVRGGPWIP